jgi:predicted HicB family RNase H-like nuclease
MSQAETQSKILMIRVTPALKKRLKAAADSANKRMATYARIVLIEAVGDQPTPPDPQPFDSA